MVRALADSLRFQLGRLMQPGNHLMRPGGLLGRLRLQASDVCPCPGQQFRGLIAGLRAYRLAGRVGVIENGPADLSVFVRVGAGSDADLIDLVLDFAATL